MLTKSDIRESLLAIWHDLCGRVADDNSTLSTLGAGSMVNLMLKKKIYQRFQLEVKVADLFKHAEFSRQVNLLAEKLVTPTEEATDNQEPSPGMDLPWLEHCLQDFQLPGANVSLYKGGVAHTLAGGIENCETQSLLTPDHRYRVYCIGKVLLAYTVLRLVDQQKIGLNQPVNEIVPGLFASGGPGEQITLRMLLSHTAGLDETVMNPVIHQATGLGQVVGEIGNFDQAARPGELFIYSSASYIVVAFLIEHLTGLGWKEAMEMLLFKPLGISEGADATLGLMAKGHTKGADLSHFRVVDEDLISHLPDFLEMVASTKIALTSESLLKLAVVPLLQGRTISGEPFLSPSLAAQLVTLQTPIEGHFYLSGWSLGWFAYADEGVFGFLSGANGHHTAVVIDSKNGQAMVAQTNTSQNHEFFDHLASRLLGVRLLKTSACFPEFGLETCYGDYQAKGMEVTISPDPENSEGARINTRFTTAQGSWSEMMQGQVVPSGKGDYLVKPKVSPMHGSLSFHDFSGKGEVSHLRISQRLCRKLPA